jgi:hypothetical protein
MKFIGIIFAGLIGGAFLLTGCNSVPSGAPPKGDIVSQDDVKNIYSSAAAVNYLITSLSAFAVKNIPKDSTVVQKFDATDKSLNFYPDKVFKSAAAIARFSSGPAGRAGDYRLISNIKGSEILVWEMSLIREQDNVAIWSETIKIDQGKLE